MLISLGSTFPHNAAGSFLQTFVASATELLFVISGGQEKLNKNTATFHGFMAQVLRPLSLAKTNEIVYSIGSTSNRFGNVRFEGSKTLYLKPENNRPFTLYVVKLFVGNSRDASTSNRCNPIYKNPIQSICSQLEKTDYRHVKRVHWHKYSTLLVVRLLHQTN